MMKVGNLLFARTELWRALTESGAEAKPKGAARASKLGGALRLYSADVTDITRARACRPTGRRLLSLSLRPDRALAGSQTQ